MLTRKIKELKMYNLTIQVKPKNGKWQWDSIIVTASDKREAYAIGEHKLNLIRMQNEDAIKFMWE